MATDTTETTYREEVLLRALREIRALCDAPYFSAERREQVRTKADGAIRAVLGHP